MEPSSQPKAKEKMGLPRVLLACGFMLVLLAVAVGAAAKGESQWSMYIALTGVGGIGVGIILSLVEKITGKPIGRRNQQAG